MWGIEVKKRGCTQAIMGGAPGIICDTKLSTRVKIRVYNTALRPATLCGMETALIRRKEDELEVAGISIQSFALDVIRTDKIRNEYIMGQQRLSGWKKIAEVDV